MSDFDYKRYLASREWAEKKEAVRKRCEGWCERCHVRSYQSTHHVTYANIGHEPLEDLLAVCNPCHEYLSAKRNQDPAREVAFTIIAFPSEILSDAHWARVITDISGQCIGALFESRPGGSVDVAIFTDWVKRVFPLGVPPAPGITAGLL